MFDRRNIFTPQNKENINKPFLVKYDLEPTDKAKKSHDSFNKTNNGSFISIIETEPFKKTNINKLEERLNIEKKVKDFNPNMNISNKLEEKILRKIDSIENTQNYLLSSINSLMKKKITKRNILDKNNLIDLSYKETKNSKIIKNNKLINLNKNEYISNELYKHSLVSKMIYYIFYFHQIFIHKCNLTFMQILVKT